MLAAARVPGVKEKLANGYAANGRTWKIRADGYDFMPCFKGDVRKPPREEILHFGQGGEPNTVRWNDGKVGFARIDGNIASGSRKVTGWPLIVNLRAGPYEKMPFESGMCWRRYAGDIWLFVPVRQQIKDFLVSIPPYPFQEGAGLNAAEINSQTLKAAQALKHLHELESPQAPTNATGRCIGRERVHARPLAHRAWPPKPRARERGRSPERERAPLAAAGTSKVLVAAPCQAQDAPWMTSAATRPAFLGLLFSYCPVLRRSANDITGLTGTIGIGRAFRSSGRSLSADGRRTFLRREPC